MDLLRRLPPEYDNNGSIHDNFARFFDWAGSLRNPMGQLPAIGEELGFGIQRHPLGFVAVYLSPKGQGFETDHLSATARANIYPCGEQPLEDIHCHGFDFRSGVIAGTLINTLYTIDPKPRPLGEGYVGYETRADMFGQNHTQQVTDATVGVTHLATHELQPGQTYDMRAEKDFHRVDSGDEGAVTLFVKTPSDYTARSLVLKAPDQPPPPQTY